MQFIKQSKVVTRGLLGIGTERNGMGFAEIEHNGTEFYRVHYERDGL